MCFKNRSIRRRAAAIAVAIAVYLSAAPAMLTAQEKSTEKAQGGSSPAGLNATDPVLVVTLGSIDKLTKDINYLTGTLGKPEAGGMFGFLAAQYAAGIDTTQPIAVLVPLVNGVPQPIALVPTADVKAVLKQREPQIGPADELDDGTLVIALGATTVFIRQAGNWAILAPSRELLDLAPADPLSVFEGMGNDYNVSVRLKMQQVPAEARGMLIAQIRSGFEQATAKQSEAEATATRQMAAGSLDQLEQIIDETDEIRFGFNIDRSSEQVGIDVSFTAVAGSDLAAMYGGQQAIESQFSSVIRENAAAFYHAATSISPASVKQARASLGTTIAAVSKAVDAESKLNPGQQTDLKKLITRVGDLVLKSIEEGKIDIGAMLLADQNDFQFVFGAFVADGNEVLKLVKEFAQVVAKESDGPRFKFDQSSYKGIAFHVMEADVPEHEDEARRMFGDTLRLHVGTGKKAIYVAIGKNSEEMLKEVIDAGGSDIVGDRPVGQLRIALLPILQYAHSIEANDSLAAMIDALARSPDPGQLIVVSNSIENGARSSITVGEGLLRAIGAAVIQAQEASQF